MTNIFDFRAARFVELCRLRKIDNMMIREGLVQHNHFKVLRETCMDIVR